MLSSLKIGLGSEARETIQKQQLVCSQSSVSVCMFDANALRNQPTGLISGLANAYWLDKNYSGVIKVYSAREANVELHATEHWQYAQALWFSRERDRAVDQFRAAQMVYGLTSQDLIDLSAWQVRAGDFDGGQLTIGNLRRIAPSVGSCQAIYISLFLLPDPSTVEIFENADSQSICRKNTQKWKGYLESAASTTDPAYRWLLLGLGFAQDNAWRMAAAAMESSVIANPSYAGAWAYLAEARWQLGEPEWPVLQRAYELDPEAPVVRSLMALHFRRQKQPEIALEIYQKLIQEFPDQAVWLVEIGNTYVEMGNLIDGLTNLTSAAKVEPKDPQIWASLAGFSFNYQVDVKSIGLPAAEQYLELDPDNPMAMDMVGLGKLLLEDFSGAETYFLNAIAKDELFTQAYLHLAQAYLGQNRYKEARQTFEIVLKQDGPSVEIARRLMQYYFPDSH